MLIAEIFKNKIQQGDIGLEIEVQGHNLPKLDTFHWKTEADGSLKGAGEGLEYVLKKPVEIGALYDVLTNWKKAFDLSTVVPSYHAGIHVHANLQRHSAKQVVNLLVCLIILEDLLVKWCGPTREGNHFCLRTSDTDYLIGFLRKMIVDGDFSALQKNGKHHLDGGIGGGGGGNDNIRYSAYNLKALYQYGSLEFRSMASTMDIDRIFTWCKVIHRIVEESKKFDSPSSIITDISVGGYNNFLRRMLGANSREFVTEDYVSIMRGGVVRAQELAFCRDWNSINMNIFKGTKGAF